MVLLCVAIAVTSVFRGRFVLENDEVKHCVVGGGKSRECEVYGGRQDKLGCPIGMSARSLEKENDTYPKDVRNIEEPPHHKTDVDFRVDVIEEPG